MKAILILLLIFAVDVIDAQTYKVIDKETSEAVPYANICFKTIDGKTFYTTSNLDGSFVYKYNKKAQMAISFVGYQTLIDTIEPNKSKIFLIAPDVFYINQVVITATKTRKALKDAPVLTQVIPAKQIENQALTSVQDVLTQEIPGLDFQQVGYGTDINMQGLSAKNILILIDGEPLAGENGNNIDYNRINTDNIERIEIVKGASSSLYGSKAMGGVINIITKNPRKKLELSVSGKLSEMNQLNFRNVKTYDDNYYYKQKLDLPNANLNMNIGFNLNRIKGQTQISAKSFDAYKLEDKYGESFDVINIDTVLSFPKYTTYVDGYEDYTLSQKIGINITKKINLDVKASYYNHNQYDFVNDNKNQQYQDFNYSAKLNYDISNKLNANAVFYRDSYKKYYYFNKLGAKDLNYNNILSNAKLSSTYDYSKKHTFNAGLEFLNDYLLSDKFIADTLLAKDVNTSVLYLQDEYDLNSKLNITAGGRFDYHEEFGLHFSPKISLMYKYGSHRFRLNYATGFRSPTLKELYMNWNLLGMFTIQGNENLKPETNQYLSFSGEYTKNNFNGSVNFYSNFFKNKIDGVWKNNQSVYQYTNLSSTNIYGIEILIRYHLLKHFNLSGGYSFLQTNMSAENSMSTFSPHSGNFRIEYNLTKKFYMLNVNLNTKITGAKKYDTYNEIEYNGQYVKAWYTVEYAPYALWNLAISQSFFNGLKIVAGVDNIFNFRADVVNFNTSITPGRRAFVSLKIDVDKFFNTNPLNFNKNEEN